MILRNTFKKYSEISKVHQGDLFLVVAAVAGEGEVYEGGAIPCRREFCGL